MARATPDEVYALVGVPADSETLPCNTVILFIDMATCIIERALPCITQKEISEACIKLAETAIAAHLLSVSGVLHAHGHGTKKKETFENWTVEWSVVNTSSQAGLFNSHFGSAANSMLGGCLTNVDKATASIFLGGGAGSCLC